MHNLGLKTSSAFQLLLQPCVRYWFSILLFAGLDMDDGKFEEPIGSIDLA
jgi:hypothetical protein